MLSVQFLPFQSTSQNTARQNTLKTFNGTANYFKDMSEICSPDFQLPHISDSAIRFLVFHINQSMRHIIYYPLPHYETK